MLPESLKSQWQQSFDEAVQHVESCVEDVPEGHYDAQFVALAKWMLTTDVTPYEYMPSGYKECIRTAQGASEVLSLLHHALVDDGEVSFVTLCKHGEVLRHFMVFACQYDDYFRRLCLKECADDIRCLIRSSSILHKIYTENGKPSKGVLTEDDFTFTAHHDPLRFIKEVTDLDVAQKAQVDEYIGRVIQLSQQGNVPQ